MRERWQIPNSRRLNELDWVFTSAVVLPKLSSVPGLFNYLNSRQLCCYMNIPHIFALYFLSGSFVKKNYVPVLLFASITHTCPCWQYHLFNVMSYCFENHGITQYRNVPFSTLGLHQPAGILLIPLIPFSNGWFHGKQTYPLQSLLITETAPTQAIPYTLSTLSTIPWILVSSTNFSLMPNALNSNDCYPLYWFQLFVTPHQAPRVGDERFPMPESGKWGSPFFI